MASVHGWMMPLAVRLRSIAGTHCVTKAGAKAPTMATALTTGTAPTMAKAIRRAVTHF